MKEICLVVSDMHCMHCVERIKKAVKAIKGVKKVAIDLDSKSVKVSFNEAKVSSEAIAMAIHEEGFTVE